MLLYELATLDLTDPVFNPLWRQGCFILPFVLQLGVKDSIFSWEVGTAFIDSIKSYWSLEIIYISHLILSGLLILSSF